ncbi:hypothetical protein FACS1894206_00790 [Deltaproteobacteria bacterium]|nr:hypothetical protein FACS1894206_00790 [Deltaproteobacteria bacterium]
MKPIKVVLCSYSFGIGNGIAHADSSLIDGIDKNYFTLKPFVLRPDFAPGRVENDGRSSHISLLDAYAVLREESRDADVLQFNGAFDPVAANAAAASGVPGIVEVMHQMETGGLHEAVDNVVCVSELVHSVQTHEQAVVIFNGIDVGKFSFQPGRRDQEEVRVIQVANASKALHYELSELAAQLDNPALRQLVVGDRKPASGVPSLGVVEDMPPVYHNADLLCLIERRSAFGLVFAEAMACGTLPIISSDSGAVAFVRHGETGWVVYPLTPEAACSTLREAVNTVGSAQFVEMQYAARKLIESRFSRERMLSDYQKLWATAAERPRKAKRPPTSWMNLMLFELLIRDGNPRATQLLKAWLDDPRTLEPHFMRQPLGQLVLVHALRDICPQMLKLGQNSLVQAMCAKLRHSRCITPLLDQVARQADCHV